MASAPAGMLEQSELPDPRSTTTSPVLSADSKSVGAEDESPISLQDAAERASESDGHRPGMQITASSLESPKCWICLQTKEEDTSTSSQWRAPCTCALRAHEECLLDWVAEAQKPRAGQSGNTVACPQCKTPIAIYRPKSYVADIVQGTVRIAQRIVLPITGLSLVGGIVCGCWFYGLTTIYIIFGAEDGERILGLTAEANSWVSVSLPLIPIALVATRFKAADTIFPALPIAYLFVSRPTTEAPLWPPSASMTLITLPYIRAIYTAGYKYFVADREKAWIKEIQPRAGENGEGANEGDGEDANRAGNGLDIEVGFQVVVEEEDALQPAMEEAPPAAQEHDFNHLEMNPQGADNQAPEDNLAPALNAPPPRAQRQVNNMPIMLSVILERFVGALLLPTIAAGVGLALKKILPHTWVTPPGQWDKYPSGFLQSRFGRSIAGGCLFVVMKDSLLLYAKYQTAQTHKQRRILDFVGSKRQG